MSTIVAEARLSLAAAWLLARGDRSGYGLMNLSADGFWRSFAAILPVLPLYLYSADVGSRLSIGGGDVAGAAPTTTLGIVLSLAIQWVVWPVIIAAVAALVGWGPNFVRYIIAFNWSSVYVIGVMLPPLMLFDAGLIGSNAASLLSIAAMAAALWMRWTVAVTGLGISGVAAAGLVVGELLLSLGVNHLFE